MQEKVEMKENEKLHDLLSKTLFLETFGWKNFHLFLLTIAATNLSSQWY